MEQQELQKLFKDKVILIIEDDEFISRVYTKWLTKYGFKVLVANNGALGLDILHKEHIDITLLDLGMPGLNGIDTLMLLRQDDKTKNLKVIVLSNTTMIENRPGFEEIKNAGVSEILRKYETSLTDLLESIRRSLLQVA